MISFILKHGKITKFFKYIQNRQTYWYSTELNLINERDLNRNFNNLNSLQFCIILYYVQLYLNISSKNRIRVYIVRTSNVL